MSFILMELCYTGHTLNLIIFMKYKYLMFVTSLIFVGAGCSPAAQTFNSPSTNTVLTPTNSQSPTPSIIPPMSPTKSLPKPSLLINTTKAYTAVLKTSVGDITIALNAKETPVTVNNFVYLAQNKFYDSTIFHRVIDDFMIQGGDPKGDGTGDPGYRFDDEPFTGSYGRGTVAMANSGPDTNGSQFFIMQADQSLQPNYVIFGQVTAGMNVVDTIAKAPVTANQMRERSVPISPVTLNTIEILEK